MIFSGCTHSISPRPHFDRDAGAYLAPFPNKKKVAAKLEKIKPAANQLEKIAMSYIGVPYRYGGTSAKGMDCSGYIYRVYLRTYGLRLPHSSSALYHLGKIVSKSDLKSGDLVFFGNKWKISHSGIYLRNGIFLHASSSKGISKASLESRYFRTRYRGARRIVD